MNFTGNQQTFQNPLVDITNTQQRNNDLPNRRNKTINNICRIWNNLLNEFVVASSSCAAHTNNESHGHCIVPEHTNDPLDQTHESYPNETTRNTGNNMMQSSQGGDLSPEPWLEDSKKLGQEMRTLPMRMSITPLPYSLGANNPNLIMHMSLNPFWRALSFAHNHNPCILGWGESLLLLWWKRENWII